MKGEFYLGVPSSDMTTVPPRLGDGFSADTIEEARRKGCAMLREMGILHSFLVKVNPRDKSVTVCGTLRSDDMVSPAMVIGGACIQDDPEAFEGTWRQVKPKVPRRSVRNNPVPAIPKEGERWARRYPTIL